MANYKDHKKISVQILKNVSHWMETSKMDYQLVDLESVLEEAFRHYEAYVELKAENPSYKPDFERKSYK